MQPVQNITVDDRVSRTQYQYTLEDPDQNELNTWTNLFVAKLKNVKGLEDVATDQQVGGLAVSLVIDRVTASRLGIAPTTIDNTLYDAFGQRQINTMYTQLNQYHVIMEALPQFQLDPNMLNHIFVQAGAAAGTSGAGASTSSGRGSTSAGSNATTESALYTPTASTLTPPASVITPTAGTGVNWGRRDERSAQQCRAAERILVFRDDDGAVVDHAPGTVPVDHCFVQPGAERLSGRGHRFNRQAAEEHEYAGELAGRFPGHRGFVPEFAVE
jgi:hypothetical protein